MAKKGSFSKVYDKNGDYVDVEAARFDGTRTFQMQGDVSATQTWNGDSASALTLNTSIGAKKVTTDKINDKAVQTGQIDDGAVGLTQIATNAMNGTVQDNDSKLATHAAVKTYVDSQISGQGTYLGKHTVAEINAMVTDNLHNGDRVMTSDSGTINLGPGGVGFDVEAGEDLILYKSGSTVQWDSMDGNFKTKQTAVSDPTASGTGLTFIDSASQDENGEMTLSKKTVQDGTTSQKGVVQLEDSHSSTSTTKAATPNSVKEAYDLASTANSGLADKQDKPSSATENNIATFNGSKSTKDSGKAFLPSTSTWDGTSDDKVPTAKAVQTQLDNKGDADNVVAIYDGYMRRMSETTGWRKLAYKTVPATNVNINSTFRLYLIGSNNEHVGLGDLVVNIRLDGTGHVPDCRTNELMFYKEFSVTCKIKVTATSDNAVIEIWFRPITFSMLMISCLGSGLDVTSEKKNWSFGQYLDATDSEPVADTANGVYVFNGTKKVFQRDVVPTAAGNFAGLDANGLLTDSGKKAADFELVANKVTSVRAASSATDTAYPSEKAVRNSLDGKLNATKLSSESSIDLNTITSAGYYELYAPSFTNSPVSGNQISVLVTDMRERKYQLLMSGNDVGTTQGAKLFIRHRSLTAWGSWVELANTSAVDAKADKVSSATSGNFAGLDSNGNLTDSGSKASDFATSVQGSKADSAIQGVKVNNTTLTPDANKVVNVPIATTSADGAMSAADKTKLEGIEAGAEANVQADWNETSSSADSFIKNKPYYQSSSRANAGYIKICSTPVFDSDSVFSGVEIDLLCRFGSNSFKATLLYKNSWSLLISQNGSAGSSGQLVKFYYVASSTKIDIYAYVPGATCVTASTSLFLPKSKVDFTGFDTFVTTLPDGSQEIDPKYLTYSASSSGTAPVKVSSYGALTPVPMDSTPTESSPNLMTSGAIKTALDEKAPLASPALTGTPTAPTAASGTNSTQIATTEFVNTALAPLSSTKNGSLYGNYVAGVYQKLAEIKPTGGIGDVIAEFDVLSGRSDTGNIVGTLCVRIRNNSSSYVVEGIHFSSKVGDIKPQLKLYKRNDGYALVYGYIATAEYAYISITPRQCLHLNGTRLPINDYITLYNGNGTTTAPTDVTEITILTLNNTYTTSSDGKAGSSSVPVFVDNRGVIKACTDDFVHDAEIAKMVQVSTAGTAVGSTYQPVYVDSSGVVQESNPAVLRAPNARGFGANTGFVKAATFSFNSTNDAAAGVVLLLSARGGDAGSAEILISISFTEYGSTEGSEPVKGRAIVLNKRLTLVSIQACYAIHIVRKTSTTYELWLRTKIAYQLYGLTKVAGGGTTVIETASATPQQTLPEGYTSVELVMQHAVSVQGESAGSASVPVYVNTSGVVTACTDDFARDSEVITNVEYVAAQSGGGGNINKTKNGTPTSVLAFMTTTEAHSLWTNAKANAS